MYKKHEEEAKRGKYIIIGSLIFLGGLIAYTLIYSNNLNGEDKNPSAL